MRRLSENEVELTDAEIQAVEWFDQWLDKGHGIAFAASLALNRMRAEFEHPSDQFVAYLSEDTCERWGSRIRVRPQRRGAS